MFAERCEVNSWNRSANSDGRIRLWSSWSDLSASGGKGSLMSSQSLAATARLQFYFLNASIQELLCVCQARLARRGIMSSTCPSVRPSVCYTTCEHDILKTNEPVLMPVGTCGSRGKGMKRSTLGSGGQRSRSLKTEIGHKNPFGETS